ncbi:DUF4149 domain-containing protein [Pseudomonas lalucatii]|uniref:DUF4149 domain-containing protein n=1 Tax=Pseudomonas lalucatii TaxID=1424203 RepID=A0ABS5Q069_9PSED|nr:DUF4149 domain-containing protein [Pseudomonas lalucatii]MBS7662034.1 DUF4149 domain-containing protein [Pseudomonas lalucatii]MBS7726146.1 DUF4149 domain-containing protein [Pseudomonas lalucatii]QVM88838.1 DUF4149 domain-containing protein [Pseudomonas lalucatii]
MNAAAIGWLLAQTLWVGGLWLLYFLVLPALAALGLAPLLIEEIGSALAALLIGLTACCAVLQLLVLVRVERLASLWRDIRGQLLVTVLLMAGGYFVVRQWCPDAQRWLSFSYLALAFCGLLLVLQPVPMRRT